jgi:hypothetical protein
MARFVKHIDSFILEFCSVIANKYNLDKTELFNIWKEEDNSDEKETKIISNSNKNVSNHEMTREKINTSTKDMLIAFCKLKGIKQSGKKEEIVKRLLDVLDKEEKNSKPILSVISDNKDKIEIRKNKFGNMEHFETGLVFKNSVVIGTQNQNSKIDNLTDKTIELCKKYKFNYTIPDNLSVNNKDLDEEDEEELDEDDIDDDEEDLENEVDLEDD